VSVNANDVHLDAVQMHVTPTEIPPLYVGAMREKSLQLAGRVGDGTVLTAMSSPDYVRWARAHIQAGMAENERRTHRVVVYLDVKVSADGQAARDAVRHAFAARLPWADVQLDALGIAGDAANLLAQHGAENLAAHIPDAWVDAFAAAGAPEHVARALARWRDAGADTIVFQPLNGDPDCLDEYARELMPLLKRNL
jgi:alkanesulfonate monooxygenase SsuD/methylene tetrahydromethanopterin reductase-like flavin-dependent oxidoreductase (luciferase family)